MENVPEPTRRELANALLNAERIVKVLVMRLGGKVEIPLHELQVFASDLELEVEQDTIDLVVRYKIRPGPDASKNWKDSTSATPIKDLKALQQLRGKATGPL
jgi:hypothetical protein